MLTEEEQQWLHDRLAGSFYAFCKWCPQYEACQKYKQHCPTRENVMSVIEAAEFEARVAAKLARMSVDAILPCYQTNGDCPYTNPNCAWCRLMVARFSVEEEMDNEP